MRSYLIEKEFLNPLFKTENVKGAYSVVEYEIGVKPTDDFIFDPAKEAPNSDSGVGLNEGLREIFSKAVNKINSTPGVDFQLEQPENAPIAVQTQSYISGLFSLDKYSSLPGLISARRAEGAKSGTQTRLAIVPNAHVVRLNLPKIERDGQQLDGYNVNGLTIHYNGRFVDLKLKPTTIVVIAMSELESTRLALESFSIAEKRQRQELMGANLLNHLRRDVTVKIKRERFNELYKIATGSNETLVERPQTAALHLQSFSDRGRFHFQIQSAVNVEGQSDVIYRMIPDLEAARMIAEQGANLDATVNIAVRGIGELRGERDGSIITKPDKNWANLANEDQNDPIFQHRRLFTHYRDESNNDMWKDMDDAFDRIANELSMEVAPEIRQGLGTTWHEAGTLWMGDDPYQSVTDVNGRFHHVGNVVCVDQSIFPTVGSANPVLTGLTLARKAAEAIAERFKSTEPPPVNPFPETGIRQLWPNEKAKWKRSFDQQPLELNRDYFETPTFSVINIDRTNSPTDQLPFIYFDEPFQDFRLTLQWMSFLLDGDVSANSGIVLRSPQPPSIIDAAFYDQLIEVQIDETGYDFFSDQRTFSSPLHKTGAIYRLAPAKLWATKLPFTPGESREGVWNTYEIEVKGSSITVRLNGYLVSKTNDLPSNLQNSGYIGLQYHTGITHFGNIRLEAL
ncbi:family 16 glycoside hydrolase (plasmid) [Nostoc sp. UHCC 0302]|uniref:family 16 glycoside hydrolase n=1 Tax=Nostoc sp. UHCC 0302 TaxID=3134896 RepID=UPI00311CBEBD